MSTILLTGAKASKRVSFILQPLYSSFSSVRYASINSGINRGLRKSKGVGFRGKEKGRPSRKDGGDGGDGGRGFQIPGSVPYARATRKSRGSADDFGGSNKSMQSRFKGNGRDSQFKPEYKTSSTFGDRSNIETSKKGKFEKSSRGRTKNSHEEESFDRYRKPRDSETGHEKKSYRSMDETVSYEKKSFGKSYKNQEDHLSVPKTSFKNFYQSRDSRPQDEQKSYKNLEAVSKLFGLGYEGPRKWDKGYTYPSKYPTREERLAVKAARSGSSSESPRSPSKYPTREERPAVKAARSGSSSESPRSPSKYPTREERPAVKAARSGSSSKSPRSFPSKYSSREERPEVKSVRSGSSSESRQSSPRSELPSESPSDSSSPKISSSFAKKMPITIPYTTPASEFLYGTSVVEAALNARPRKGRKLYKLYIHKGEDRQNGERDGVIARLAQKKGVEVVVVKGFEWLRTLDKMCQGRPHNGYILETSPLPRLPVTSLGSVIDQDDSSAIKLTLDHQSREEIEINGTDTIIKVAKDSTGRKPFILLLDSVEDPQNLGAILRTACFMGVTAVAISTRNSSPFTPVVFKASAGAAETIEIFSVNKPAGFVKDSQAAGWKIYAAVAPPAPRKADGRYMWPPTSKQSVWTHDLKDPLREDPCILMIGGEGEGLRRNLRDHADVNISIKGAAVRGQLDSLNVSVATGMLCDAFMRQTTRKTVKEAVKEVEEEMNELDENQIF
ncbi:hypothetical protein NHQ30_008766 [Ciborinia camelliae]|nr:hypothetical protein NHQ30_008766 [Ciborinia camelliae]